jgi:hypothetical protein
MSHSPSAPEADDQLQDQSAPSEGQLPLSTNEPQPSYVKLAMRNMVKKRGTSLFHFALTTVGLLTVLVGLAYLTR